MHLHVPPPPALEPLFVDPVELALERVDERHARGRGGLAGDGVGDGLDQIEEEPALVTGSIREGKL